MIKNQKQLTVTENQRQKLKESFERLKDSGDGNPATQLHMKALQADIEKLDAEIARYREAAEGNFDPRRLAVLDHFGEELVYARIACGLTQKDLAAKLGMKEQQLQRHERKNYESASLHTVRRISGVISKTLHERRTNAGT